MHGNHLALGHSPVSVVFCTKFLLRLVLFVVFVLIYMTVSFFFFSVQF